MLVCRLQPSRLTALSLCSPLSTRSTSTSPTAASTSTPADESQESIFTAPESPWDHVFSDLEPVPPPAAQRLRTRLIHSKNPAAAPSSKKGHGQGHTLVQRSSSGARHRRASLTAREMSVFDEMFDLIFNAVSARDGKASAASASASASASALASGSGRTPPPPHAVSAPSLSGQTPGIGRGGGAPFNDIFRTLRRHTSRVRWTTAIDEELDRKKETMELFNTDHDLLQWVLSELFGEAQQWDEEAQRVMAASGSGAGSGAAAGTITTTTATTTAQGKAGSSAPREGPGKYSIYPHLIAHAMRIFRTTYANPSLSLAVFHHAARVSIPSYVFGCTAPAYNELIEAKWEGWGDLEGICSALEEMKANGVKLDGRTRIVAERVRREVGEARPVECGGTAVDDVREVNPLARKVWGEVGEAAVMKLLHRIERLALRDRSRKSAPSPHEESWKSTVLQPDGDDGWRFDEWNEGRTSGDGRDQRRRMRATCRDGIHSRTLDGWGELGNSDGEKTWR